MANILVVDDEVLIRDLLHLRLTRAGHAVYGVGNGQDALAFLADNTVQLMITDIFMPEKEGLETILEVKKRHPQIKIIAISGGTPVSAMDFLDTAMEFGADRQYKKPLNHEQLLRAIDECLSEVSDVESPTRGGGG